MMLKLNAYLWRDKIRDLYDITFIYKHYTNLLQPNVVTQLQYAIAQKGLEYFDYIIQTQNDRLIDKDKLTSDFLDVYYDLGLYDVIKTKNRETYYEKVIKYYIGFIIIDGTTNASTSR